MTAIKQIEDALKPEYLLGAMREWFNRSIQGHHTGSNKSWKRVNEMVLQLFKEREEVLAHIAAQDAEIARLTKCLAAANSNAEEFERKWYLLGDEIARLREHLTAVLRLSNSIEVLGEWSATESNITSGKKLRAEVDAILKAARAALATTTPKGAA